MSLRSIWRENVSKQTSQNLNKSLSMKIQYSDRDLMLIDYKKLSIRHFILFLKFFFAFD